MLAQNSGHSDFENAKPGTYTALCFKVIDLGKQPSTYKGQPSDPVRKVLIYWELDAKMEDGRPYIVTNRYTLSLGKKAYLRRDLESWFAKKFSKESADKGFPMNQLLGKSCMLSLVDNGDYVNVSAVMKRPDSVPKPKPINKPVFFSLDKFDQAIFDNLSESLQLKIKQSPEYKKIFAGVGDDQDGGPGPDAPHTNPDDDIPF